MKLKEALKKFNFIKRLNVPEKLYPKIISNLLNILKGSEAKYMSPLGKTYTPIPLLMEWDKVFEKNKHKINKELLEIEKQQYDKFSPRSMATPWADRKQSLLASFHNQTENFNPEFHEFEAKGDLSPLATGAAIEKIRNNTSSGLPFHTTKGRAIGELFSDYDGFLKREDPALLFTRTAEMKKTRNVWGYPFADVFFESKFFFPFLETMREKYWQASVISPDVVDIRLTEIVLRAIETDRMLYSVDFDGFDASVSWQFIVKAFDYVKRSFDPMFSEFIDRICLRFYTIGIVTPTGILRGKHGVPSGSCFTNLIDSLVQAGIALTLDFINECEMQINGDDGVYIVAQENITTFEDVWKKSKLNLGSTSTKGKSNIAKNWCTYCQRFYHIDYLKDGLIGGIYPVYRAINRLIWLEKFTDLKKAGISSRDHFGIRTLSILEQTKYHPMFEDLVRFILEREKYALEVSDCGLVAYTEGLSKGRIQVEEEDEFLNAEGKGIKSFESYKMIRRIIETEGYFDVVDFDESNETEEEELLSNVD